MRGMMLLPVAMAAAVGVPYALTNFSASKDTPAQTETEEQPTESTQVSVTESAIVLQQGIGLDSPRDVEGPPVGRFDEIFRFDVSTAWILSRWPRVTTRLSDLDLQGYRVPLVTGTRDDDLAGALTYYFDADQKVQRITFYGSTGDARRLVTDLTQRFEMIHQPNDDAGLFLYQRKWSGKVNAELRVRPSDVVVSSDPRSRFNVALVMDRPRGMDKPQPFGTRAKSTAAAMPVPSASPRPQPYSSSITGPGMYGPTPSNSGYPNVPGNVQTGLPQTTSSAMPIQPSANATGQTMYGSAYSGQAYSGQPVQAPTMPAQTIAQPGGVQVSSPQTAPVNGYGAPPGVAPQGAPAQSGGLSGFWNWITGG